ncbi:hypothetical protein MMJ50_12605 [Enterococcus cecorum]|uniref:hypothetical protein n=1 Tax=Enterococcus cecorum TaxID=44008 RepID=UPI001FAE4F16|nr:hypothetical protein [Enterococcus cecorum]MCJ0593492.1 hypothetical protein [Enterococcus cecorum]
MTDGASQGLYVIVAVVIFGIFVLISYMLFRDNLQPSLSSIFTDSLEQAEDSIDSKIITKIKVVEKVRRLSIKKNQSAEYYINEFTKAFEFRDQDNELINVRKLNLVFKFHDTGSTVPTFEEFMENYSNRGFLNLRMGVTATLKTDKSVTATTAVNGIAGINIE